MEFHTPQNNDDFMCNINFNNQEGDLVVIHGACWEFFKLVVETIY